MQHGQRRLIAAIAAIFVTIGGIWLILFTTGAIPPPGKSAGLFRMSDRIADLQVVETPGGLRYRFGETHLTPGEFAEQLKSRRPEGSRGRVYSLLNITGTAGFFWIAIGLLGQVLFTGRMIMQWIASEKLKRSVIPNVFWWMSLGGATMLIIYFIWRVDIVGIIGQSAGWFIYMRNLWFIYSSPVDHNS
ncbi:MAG: lipid-A-disaccharide synthase N-terminal domain-containing protein [Verrucomicrobiales bacterium]|jgi:lipid-A-disaccharide synthase-like uncharacterized protein